MFAEHHGVGDGTLRARRGEIELKPVDLGERARPAEQVVEVRGMHHAGPVVAHEALGSGSAGVGRSGALAPELRDGICSGPVPR